MQSVDMSLFRLAKRWMQRSLFTLSDTDELVAMHYPPATLPPPTTTDGSSVSEFGTALEPTCQICLDSTDAFQAHVCVACSSSCCSACLQQYMTFKILDGEVSSKKLVCPAPECLRPLPEDLIGALVQQETFAKYQSFLKNQKTGVRFCPRAGCCAIINEPLFCRDRKVKCTECETESCMRCGGDYHRTRLCRRVDKRYNKWKRRHKVRVCPNCKSDIEKDGGCLHMSCTRCDQEFCWACLQPWSRHNSKLCIPLADFRVHGFLAPLVLVMKGVVVGVVGAVALSATAGVVVVAVVVVPPVCGYIHVRNTIRGHKEKRRQRSKVVDPFAQVDIPDEYIL